MREDVNRIFWNAVKQDASRAVSEYPSLLDTADDDEWTSITFRAAPLTPEQIRRVLGNPWRNHDHK